MPGPSHPTSSAPAHAWGTWTVAGGPDPDFDDLARDTHRTLLTDPSLPTAFPRGLMTRAPLDYDVMVRRLGYVWDFSLYRTSNVAGFRCAGCGRTRAAALT